MPSQQEELRDRTKAFAVRIVRVYRALSFKTDAQVLGKQLMRSGTSVAANYRGAAAPDQKRNGLRRLALLSRKRTRQSFGWKCFRNVTSSRPRSWNRC